MKSPLLRPRLLHPVVEAYGEILSGLAFDRLAAIPYGALALGGALALHGGWSLIYPRLEIKAHGTRQGVEGVYGAGEKWDPYLSLPSDKQAAEQKDLEFINITFLKMY